MMGCLECGKRSVARLLFALTLGLLFALSGIAPLHAKADLPYSDDELEKLLLSLDVDSKFASLVVVQDGLAATVQRADVKLTSSISQDSTSTILIAFGFKVRQSADLNPAHCRAVLDRIETILLGGAWHEFPDDFGSASDRAQVEPSDDSVRVSNYHQLPGIERRVLGFVGSREDVFDDASPAEVRSRLSRYIPAYNALELWVQFTHVDESSGAVARQRCDSRNR